MSERGFPFNEIPRYPSSSKDDEIMTQWGVTEMGFKQALEALDLDYPELPMSRWYICKAIATGTRIFKGRVEEPMDAIMFEAGQLYSYLDEDPEWAWWIWADLGCWSGAWENPLNDDHILEVKGERSQLYYIQQYDLYAIAENIMILWGI